MHSNESCIAVPFVRPLLTIAIPTCNRVESLRETLNPLLTNGVLSDDCEVRVFNNASTDGTADWLATIPKQPGFTVCNQPINLGLEGNIIQALLFSPGHYVWLLSDHMAIEPQAVHALAVALRRLREQNVVLIYAVIRSYGRVFGSPYSPVAWGKISPRVQSRLIFNMSNISALIVAEPMRTAAARYLYRFSGYSYPHLGVYALIRPETRIAETDELSDFSRTQAAVERVPSYNSFRSRFIGCTDALAALPRINHSVSMTRSCLQFMIGALREDCKQMLGCVQEVDPQDLWRVMLAFPWRTKPFLLFCWALSLLPNVLRRDLAAILFRSSSGTAQSRKASFEISE